MICRAQRRGEAQQDGRDLALGLQDTALRRVGHLALVRVPHALDVREKQAVEHGASRRQHTDDAVLGVLVHEAACRQPMGAEEDAAHGQPGRTGGLRTGHHLELVVPQRTLRQPRTVVLDQGRLGADDPEASMVVTERDRDRAGHQRMGP